MAERVGGDVFGDGEPWDCGMCLFLLSDLVT